MTSPSMLDQIEALNGATDWNDPNLFERIAAADFEGDNQNAAPAAPQGDSTPAPAPTASNEPPAVAEPAKTTEPEAQGVLTRDGKHVIPFSVLEAARAKAERADALAREVETLRQQLAAQPQPPAEAVGLTEEELADLADIPQVAKLNDVVKKLAARLDEARALPPPPATPTGALTPQQIEQDQFDAGIAANPLIAKWMGDAAKGHSPEWTRAAQIDSLLKDDPTTAGLTYAERFAKVQRMVAAEFGIETPKPTPTPAAPAARQAVTPVDAPEPSLDDLGAVSPSVQSDRWAAMDSRDMRAAVDQLSDVELYRLAGVNA